MSSTIEEVVETKDRRYPLRRPPNHRVPVPRWTLKLPDGVTHIHTLYVGVQGHGRDSNTLARAEKVAEEVIYSSTGRPTAVDVLRVTHGFDIVGSKVWVAYWTDSSVFKAKLDSLDLPKLWNGLGEAKSSIGLWSESFTTPIERLETNYASLLHQPGISQVPGSEFPAHDLTGYWGSGRDRLPGSKDDLFHPPKDTGPPERAPAGIGQRLTGTNYDNMAHIRSGQWWVQCPPDERDAYENDLQKKLMRSMQYLWDNPLDSGTLGLRFLQNVNENDEAIKESCGAGYFRNWSDLERWASVEPTHLEVFVGALKHAQRFGTEKRFMTWHEVSILKEGEGTFEYVNCDPKTGVIKWVRLDQQDL